MRKRLLALFTGLMMIFGIVINIPSDAVEAASYGIKNNGLGGIYIDIYSEPYSNSGWYAYGDPYGPLGCTWFVGARVMQLTGKGSYNTQAPNTWFYSYGNSLGFSTGYEPRAQSVICWSGHVAFLEKIEGNTAYISEGGFNAASYSDYGYTHIRTVDISAISSLNSSFLGYVYLDDVQTSWYSSLTPVDVGTDFYALIFNTNYWKALTVEDDNNVDMRTEAISASQLWRFTRQADGSYVIYNGNKVLDSTGGNISGNNVYAYESYAGSDAQQWYIYGESGAYYFRSKTTDCVIDLYGNNGDDGTNIQMYTYNGSTAQQFQIWRVETELTVTPGNKNSKTSFDWFCNTGNSGYNVVICEGERLWNGDAYHVEVGASTPFEFALPAGTYTAYIDAIIEYQTVMSNVVTFTVDESYNLADAPVLGDDGWYYCDALPSDISSDEYTIQYNNISEKISETSPGNDWTNEGIASTEWRNSGEQYTSETALETSDARVLVKECYYHWCIPGAGMTTEGNYEWTSYFSHYDEIVLPNDYVHVTSTGDDNGHTYYLLAWTDGSQVYCKSGEQCDGTQETHGYRCRAWYKHYVYQDRVQVTTYRFTKETGWVSEIDSTADSTACRYRLKGIDWNTKGDINQNSAITLSDTVLLQKYLLNLEPLTSSQMEIADINSDGRVNVLDICLLKAHLI